MFCCYCSSTVESPALFLASPPFLSPSSFSLCGLLATLTILINADGDVDDSLTAHRSRQSAWPDTARLPTPTDKRDAAFLNENAACSALPRREPAPSVAMARNRRRPPASRGCVAVGIATEGFPLEGRQPGWTSQSYGWHGDDGCIFHGNATSNLRAFGPMIGRSGPGGTRARGFGPGDVVGLGLNYESRELFYTLNGAFVGVAFARDENRLGGEEMLATRPKVPPLPLPPTALRDAKVRARRREIEEYYSQRKMPPPGTVDDEKVRGNFDIRSDARHRRYLEDGLYFPCVGVDVPQPIEINLGGGKPFLFDLEAYVERQQPAGTSVQK